MTVGTALEAEADLVIEGAVARLAEEFRDQTRERIIEGVVRDCRRDLSGSPEKALPELIERLARQRLLSAVAAVDICVGCAGSLAASA